MKYKKWLGIIKEFMNKGKIVNHQDREAYDL